MSRKAYKRRIQRAESRKRRNSIIMGLVLVVLMMAGILGYGGSSNNEVANSLNAFDYNGYTIRLQDVSGNGNFVYVAFLGETQIGFFYNNPAELEIIPVSDEFKAVLATSDLLVMTSDPLPLDGQASQEKILFDEVTNQFSSLSGKTILVGTTKDSIVNNLPVYECDDASEEFPVLKLEIGNIETVPGIYNSDTPHCYIYRGFSQDIVKIRDRVFLLLKGIQVD